MLTRILLRLVFLAGLATPLSALALGVGPIEVRSALNQNLEADIPLIVNNPAELTGLIVRIPRQQEFDQVGIERLELLGKLRFAIPKPGERPVVRITSLEPIREPSFTLLLEVVWPRGRLLRNFPIHLDPELYANRRPPPPPPPPVVSPPVVVAAPTPAPAPAPILPPPPPVSFEGASFYGPIKSGETLRAIANRVRPSTAISLPDMMAILVAGNPEAFRNGNPNTLRAGAILRVPTPQALGAPGATPTPAPELATPAPVQPAPVAVTESPAPGPTEPLPPPAPPVAAAPLPAPTEPPVAATPLPAPTEPPKEIVPQASIPQPEPLPPPVATAPEPAPPPVAATPEPTPPPVARPEPVKPPSPPPAIEAEVSWMDNPVVWIAMALIVLAVGAMLLLPLLRRNARTKATANLEKTVSGEMTSTTRVQPSQPRTKRTVAEPEPAAAPRPASELAPRPAAPAMPKPINDLLRDMDLGLGTEPSVAPGGGKGAPPTPLPKPARLPDAEPPTAPITRDAGPAAASAPPARPQTPPPARPAPAADLPSELRLDGMDFNFGDLGMDTKPVRSSLDELPALELKPTPPAAKPVAVESLSMALEGFDPFTAPPPATTETQTNIKPSPGRAAASAPPPPSQKFEFSDVTQDLKNAGREDSFRLDEELQGLGGTLNLGQMDIGSATGATGADYVETKLDLATAYLDMGDQVGARSLLEDVQREGDPSQQKRAGDLLKKLG